MKPSRRAAGWTVVRAAVMSRGRRERGGGGEEDAKGVSSSMETGGGGGVGVVGWFVGLGDWVGLLSVSMTRRMANPAASFVTACKSAGTNPGVFRATSAKSTFSLTFISAHSARNISSLSAVFGTESTISRSNRPARRTAGSMVSNRLVVPRTTTTVPLSRHATANWSIQERNCETTRLVISRVLSSRFPVMLSISSSKIIEGENEIAV